MTRYRRQDKGLLVGWENEAEVPAGSNHLSRPTSTGPQAILDDSDGHLLTIAPTGAGKGTGCIIPNLLTYPGSVVVIDPKGENAAITARRRREMGHDVAIFDPFGITGETSIGLNAFDLIDKDSSEAYDDAVSIAAYVHNVTYTKDPFWDNSARNLIAALILHVASNAPPVLKNLGEVHYLLHQSHREMEFTLKELSSAKQMQVKQAGNALSSMEPKVFKSVQAVAQSTMGMFGSNAVKAVTARTDVSWDRLASSQPTTLYLILPPDKLASHGGLLRVIIASLLKKTVQTHKRPPLPTLYMLDEAAQLGPMQELRDATTLMRGYGVRVWSFWQDLSQLQRLYPFDWPTMINNASTLQMFGFNNMRMAEAAAELTGHPSAYKVYTQGRSHILLARTGDLPDLVTRPDYLTDRPFHGLFDANPLHEMEDEWVGLELDEGEANVEATKAPNGNVIAFPKDAAMKTAS